MPLDPTATDEITVFISSPGDVPDLRSAAKAVVDGLDGQVIGGAAVRLVPLLWEDRVPATIGFQPQAAIDYYLGRADRTDIYVGIFWIRVGSSVVVESLRYESGTVYELEQAYASQERSGRPRMLVYRCVRPPPPETPPDGLQPVESFFANFGSEHARYQGILGRVQDAGDLTAQLTRDLRVVVAGVVQDRRARAAGSTRTAAPEFPRSAHPQAELALQVQSILTGFDEVWAREFDQEHRFRMRFVAGPDPANPAAPVPSETLPQPGRSLLDVYNDQGSQRLLLIGEAGSGKTFAMLHLMQLLLHAALAEGEHGGPIPVHFNLSSWVRTRSEGKTRWWFRRSGRDGEVGDPTLREWLVDELVRRYAVPRRAAFRLVDRRRIVFCLDGLDEIGINASVENNGQAEADQLRLECVRTINRTLEPMVRIILCCRDDVYRSLPEKPLLGPALTLLPLSDEDVQRYLQRWDYLDGLRAALPQSSRLQKRSRSPLFLRMMAVSYAHRSENALLNTAALPEDLWEEDLLESYVAKCMSALDDHHAGASDRARAKTRTDPHGPSADLVSHDQVTRCLWWLSQTPETEFLVEDMQPSLLDLAPGTRGPESRRLYRRRSTAALSLFLALCIGLPGGAAIAVQCAGLHRPIGASLAQGLVVAAITAALGFFMSLPAFATQRWWLFGLTIGATFGIVRGVIIGLSPAPQRLTMGLGEGISAASVSIPWAIVVFLLFGHQTLGRIARYKREYASRVNIKDFEILPLESFDWRWFDSGNPWRGGWWGLLIGPIIGLSLWPRFGPARGVGFGLVVTMFVAVFSGLSGTGVKVSVAPNQGIIRSFRHGVRMAVLFTLVGALAFGLSYGVANGPLDGVVNAMLSFVLAFSFLVFGGIPVIRQICLGDALHRQGVLPSWRAWPPWNNTLALLTELVRFKLLRRSAGGYMFRHQMLRAYYQRRGARATVPGETNNA